MTDAERRAERSGVRVAAAKRQRAKGKRAMTTRHTARVEGQIKHSGEAAKPMAPPLRMRATGRTPA